MATFIVNGSVISALTLAGISALLNYAMQARDHALGNWRRLGSARTNNLGRYRITYDSAQLKELDKNRAADASAS